MEVAEFLTRTNPQFYIPSLCVLFAFVCDCMCVGSVGDYNPLSFQNKIFKAAIYQIPKLSSVTFRRYI